MADSDNVLSALQSDFKLFLQALWSQLDLSSKPGDGIDHVSDHDEAASKRINGK